MSTLFIVVHYNYKYLLCSLVQACFLNKHETIQLILQLMNRKLPVVSSSNSEVITNGLAPPPPAAPTSQPTPAPAGQDSPSTQTSPDSTSHGNEQVG